MTGGGDVSPDPTTVAYGFPYYPPTAIDVLATVGATRTLSTADQQRLIQWASARWSL